MTASFTSGVLPDDWKLAIVKPIYKKDNKFLPTNYRPISLTSLVVKIMEAIICDNLRQFLLTHNIIPAEQHSLVRGKSVNTNLLCCINDWTKYLDDGSFVDVIYFDFAKAFDRVPKKRLLLKLSHYGISGRLLQWIDSFLTNRFFKVKIAETVSASQLSGVPQGSVLGPVLFLIYSADLKNDISSPISFYADENL